MKKYLIVIDMQNDFITGSLGTHEAEMIVPKVAEKIKNHQNGEIIFTRDTHNKFYNITLEGRKLPVKHCQKGTDGWALNPNIIQAFVDNSNKEVHVSFLNKYTFGCKALPDSIGEISDPLTEFEIVGVCTDICVVSNALLLRTYYPDVRIKVDASCCAGTTPENHKAALTVMRQCQIEVINDKE